MAPADERLINSDFMEGNHGEDADDASDVSSIIDYEEAHPDAVETVPFLNIGEIEDFLNFRLEEFQAGNASNSQTTGQFFFEGSHMAPPGEDDDLPDMGDDELPDLDELDEKTPEDDKPSEEAAA